MIFYIGMLDDYVRMGPNMQYTCKANVAYLVTQQGGFHKDCMCMMFIGPCIILLTEE